MVVAVVVVVVVVVVVAVAAGVILVDVYPVCIQLRLKHVVLVSGIYYQGSGS